MWEPIPYEFLYTSDTKDRIKLEIDGYEAICTTLDCNYEYVLDNTAEITAASISSVTVTITGTSFPG